MLVRSKWHVLFFATLFSTSFMLMSCSHRVITTQIEITTSKAKLINILINADQFDVISDGIVAETQTKLLAKGIISETSEIKNFDRFILLIDYEFFELDSFPLPYGNSKNVFAMKGEINLIDSKTKQVIFNDKFDEIEDKISDFPSSVSKKISNKIANYLYSK